MVVVLKALAMGRDIINEFYAFGHVPAGPLYVEYIFIGVGLTITLVMIIREVIRTRKSKKESE